MKKRNKSFQAFLLKYNNTNSLPSNFEQAIVISPKKINSPSNTEQSATILPKMNEIYKKRVRDIQKFSISNI
jgi:hypothetical protein